MRVDVRREARHELDARHVDRREQFGRQQPALGGPARPGRADRRHRVDEHAVEVEDDRGRMKGTHLRGVIFDLDGVLVFSEPLLAEAAIALFAEKGVAMTADDFKPFIGMGEDRYLGGAAERRGIELDLERDKARLYEIYEEVIRGRLKPLPGAVELVHSCLERGLAIAVASGADRVKVVAHMRDNG